MSAGSMESPVDGDLPTEKRAEVEGVSIWFRIHGLLTRMQALLTRRHSDRGPSDYEEESDEFNVPIRRGIREPYIKIDRYDENGGGKQQSWQKWILGIVSISLVGMLSWALGKLDTLSQEVATLQATQTMGFAAIAQRQTADEQRVDRIEARIYRGAQ